MGSFNVPAPPCPERGPEAGCNRYDTCPAFFIAIVFQPEFLRKNLSTCLKIFNYDPVDRLNPSRRKLEKIVGCTP
jgi:hypothetical protein